MTRAAATHDRAAGRSCARILATARAVERRCEVELPSGPPFATRGSHTVRRLHFPLVVVGDVGSPKIATIKPYALYKRLHAGSSRTHRPPAG
ncbi:hypothetical protein C6P92_26415 [Burkholderia multivorans]|nr:hypothetical protein C6P92_26415 [Burkholderia multivorans]PRG31908.1 hypothetical protein C6T62_21445 [Burkholderia multivorans]